MFIKVNSQNSRKLVNSKMVSTHNREEVIRMSNPEVTQNFSPLSESREYYSFTLPDKENNHNKSLTEHQIKHNRDH